MSTPFIGERFTFTQPDGTRLEVIGWGNQDGAVFETPDGFRVVKDPLTGFYQYASLDSAGNLTASGFEAHTVEPHIIGLKPRTAGPTAFASLIAGVGWGAGQK